MSPSSSLRRAQEAWHRDRAAVAQLDSVRHVVATAALAWGSEALSAERREARQRRARLADDAASEQERQSAERRERGFSENPDRGYESA